MNDFDFDAMQKKKLCASARKQKNGSKSKKCSLPSDNLTAAQLRAKNGPITSCNLNEPMDWRMFKAMPADLQVEYVRGLNSRFGVGICSISRDLFRLSNSALDYHFRSHGIKLDVRGGRLSCAAKNVWENWLNSASGEEAVEGEPVPVCVEDEQEVVEESAPAVSETPAFGMSKLCVEWRGEFDPIAFVDQLKRLVLPNGEVKIRLEVEQV